MSSLKANNAGIEPETLSTTTHNDSTNILVQQSYDKIASIYLDWTLNGPSPRLDYLAHLISLLPTPSTAKILELGCGAGVPGTQFLSKMCGHVVGVDISDAQIELARKHSPSDNVEFMRSDMMSLDFSEGEFDGVVGLYSIFHLKKAEQSVLIKRIESWLKPGGIFLGNFALGGTEETHTWLGGEKMFWAGWEEKEWLGIVEQVGFEVIKGDVVPEVENGKEVSFLWVAARKRN